MIPYIGGKYNQSKWMNDNAPEHFSRYAEVFGGAMWFYIRSDFLPEVAYYNDIDPIMYNLFSCVKEYDKMVEMLEDLPTYHQETFQKMKKTVQDNANNKIEGKDFELAVAHVYIITHIFSGFTKDIWRPNLNMVKRRPNSPEYMDNHAFTKRLKDIKVQKKLDVLEVSNESYDSFIRRIDGKDLFLYIDPPYWKTEGHYRHGEFNEQDHLNLFKIIRDSECKWMLSYYDFDHLRDWFPEDEYLWKRKSFKKASGNIKKGENKNPDTEIIIMNYSTNKDNIDLFFE